jgi:DNA-binding NarL/FixJ family response regulator
VNIIVADDHALVRRGLIQMLKVSWPDARMREASALATALELLRAEAAQLLMLDLSMPGMSLPGGLQAVRAVSPTVPIIVLTAFEDRNIMLGVLSGGANAFVTKSSPVNTILDVVQRVLSGEVVVAGTLTAPRPTETSPEPANGSLLSRRQLDVLRCLCDGLATKEIARRLNLGEGTVKIHLAALYRTLGVRNRVEAVLRAHELSITSAARRQQ